MTITPEQMDAVIALADTSAEAHIVFQSTFFPNKVVPIFEMLKYNDTEEAKNRDIADNNLYSYIRNLPYDAIIDLEALMEYGRTLYQYGGYDQLMRNVREGEEEDANGLLNRAKYFWQTREYFESMYPNENFDYSLAAEYLCEKYPLNLYLKEVRDLVRYF